MDELEDIATKQLNGEQFYGQTESITINKKNKVETNMCEDHPGNKLSLYCEDEDKYICTKCLIKNRAQHFSHNIIEIKDMYKQVNLGEVEHANGEAQLKIKA